MGRLVCVHHAKPHPAWVGLGWQSFRHQYDMGGRAATAQRSGTAMVAPPALAQVALRTCPCRARMHFCAAPLLPFLRRGYHDWEHRPTLSDARNRRRSPQDHARAGHRADGQSAQQPDHLRTHGADIDDERLSRDIAQHSYSSRGYA